MNDRPNPPPAPRRPHDPERRVHCEPSPKRVRALLGGAAVADSTDVVLLLETGHPPVYYFPRADVRLDLAERTAKRSHCPFKGDATYWSFSAGGRTAENVAWSYDDPLDAVAAIAGHLAFYWDRMDAWYEEDEAVAVHPRSPYVRVDVLGSRRPVVVEIGGRTVAETTRGRFLFETGQPTRYYIPEDDVRLDLLTDSSTRSACPYKGSARYWSARIDGRDHVDVAWSYPVPLPEVRNIAGHICFDPDRVDAIRVDGRVTGGRGAGARP